MLKLLAFTFALALLALGAAWLSEHPGEMTLLWLGWRIDTSAAFLLCAVLLLAAALAGVFASLRFLLHLPQRRRRNRQERHYTLGLRALTNSLVALTEGDMKAARGALSQAQKHLGDAPVTLLLSAQLAKREGDDAETHRALEAMLGHAETRLIAARGLSEYHEHRQQAALALPHAERAFSLNPRDAKTLATLLSVLTRLGKWQEAELALNRARIAKAERQRLRAFTSYAHALALKENGEETAALSLVRAALRQWPDFSPAAVLAAELAARTGRQAEAMALLARAWKRAPHPLLADAALSLLQTGAPEEMLKSARRIVRARAAEAESRLLVARAALAAREYAAAREALKSALALGESAAACRLMAQLETAQYNDAEAAARWRSRATEAEPEPQWLCGDCGHAPAAWAIHCPQCGAFNGLEWKTRTVRFAAA